MKNILAPSILSADFKILGEQLKLTEEAGAEYIHFDVMDGMFVPSISFGMPVLASIKGATSQTLDVHLMVTEPIRYVEEFVKAGADIVTVHYEACEDVRATLEKIRECGMKTGLSISPDTPVEVLREFLGEVDMFLIMTVHPGFGGQKYIDECTDKIRTLRQTITDRGLDVKLQIDGGVNLDNLTMNIEAGADVIVAGSAVFKGNIAEKTRAFLAKM